MSAAQVGRVKSESTRPKQRGKDNRPFPAKCNMCANRDKAVCAKYNMMCTSAKEVLCFRSHIRRNQHPEYTPVDQTKCICTPKVVCERMCAVD